MFSTNKHLFDVVFQLFSTEGGQTEIHTIAKILRDPEELETEYLASYLERF